MEWLARIAAEADSNVKQRATTMPEDLVEKVLHTTVERLCDYWRMSFTGGAQSGSIGVSGHVANGLAALFLADLERLLPELEAQPASVDKALAGSFHH